MAQPIYVRGLKTGIKISMLLSDKNPVKWQIVMNRIKREEQTKTSQWGDVESGEECEGVWEGEQANNCCQSST